MSRLSVHDRETGAGATNIHSLRLCAVCYGATCQIRRPPTRETLLF